MRCCLARLWPSQFKRHTCARCVVITRNPRSRPGRPVTRTAPIGAIQYQAAARSRAGVVLPVGGLACASTTGRAVLAVVRCQGPARPGSEFRAFGFLRRWPLPAREPSTAPCRPNFLIVKTENGRKKREWRVGPKSEPAGRPAGSGQRVIQPGLECVELLSSPLHSGYLDRV